MLAYYWPLLRKEVIAAPAIPFQSDRFCDWSYDSLGQFVQIHGNPKL
jgi:hypothetical protein